MKKTMYLMLLIAAVLCNRAEAQDAAIFPKGEIGANKDNYTGTIWLSELNHPDSNFTFSIAQAVYAPGSKLNWHIIIGMTTFKRLSSPILHQEPISNIGR